MSIKNSIAYEQDKYHLYDEFDDSEVHLRIDKPAGFEVNQWGVMVVMPAEVMDELAKKWLKYRGK